jgi:hypothetical protein
MEMKAAFMNGTTLTAEYSSHRTKYDPNGEKVTNPEDKYQVLFRTEISNIRLYQTDDTGKVDYVVLDRNQIDWIVKVAKDFEEQFDYPD